MTINDVSHAEGNSGQTDFTFTASLTNPSTQTVTVAYATQDGTATTAGSDYVGGGGHAHLRPAGQTSKSVTVKVNGDTNFEPDEGFTLKLSAPPTPRSPTTAGLGTIQNDDAQPQISINDVIHTEGNSGTTAFTLHRHPVEPELPDRHGLAPDPGRHRHRRRLRLRAADGRDDHLRARPDPRSGDVNVNGDTKFEPDEDFKRQALEPHERHDRRRHRRRHDPERRRAAARSRSTTSPMREGNSGTTDFTFTVSLSNPSSQTMTVDYADPGRHRHHRRLRLRRAAPRHAHLRPGQTAKTVATSRVNGDTSSSPTRPSRSSCSGAHERDDPRRHRRRHDPERRRPAVRSRSTTCRTPRATPGQTDYRLHRLALEREHADGHGRLRDAGRQRHERRIGLRRRLGDAHLRPGPDLQDGDREGARRYGGSKSPTRPSSCSCPERPTPRSRTTRGSSTSRTTISITLGPSPPRRVGHAGPGLRALC